MIKVQQTSLLFLVQETGSEFIIPENIVQETGSMFKIS